MVEKKGVIHRDFIVILIAATVSVLVVVIIINSYINLCVARYKLSQTKKELPKKMVKTEEVGAEGDIQKEDEKKASGEESDKKDVKTDGVHKTYYKSGRLFTETNYKDGKRDGISKSYYKNSSVKQEINWKAGKPDGTLKIYYRDGNLKQEAYFKDGKRDGIEKTYYNNGKLWMEQKYKDGNRVYMKRFDKEGNLISERFF